MKIVFLDVKTIGEDIDLSAYDELGEVVKYSFSSPEEIPARVTDADVIIFLYRDVVYNQDLRDTDQERDAEAIVRKQRNGPTGTVELTFFGEYTQFKNRARV